jgi:hypothetical protein
MSTFINRGSVKSKEIQDRIEAGKIILNARGRFPKKLIIVDPRTKNCREYILRKTTTGGFILN